MVSLALLCLTLATSIQAQQVNDPRFEEYSADVWAGTVAPLNLRNNPMARKFRTSVSSRVVEEGINFAGHYSLVAVGCGTGCSITAIVDARDGKAYFPEVLNGWTGIVGDYDIPDGEGIRMFKTDSRLLRAIGRPRIGAMEGERYGPSGIYYYEWKNNRLRFVKFTFVGSYPEVDPLPKKS